MSTDDIQTLWTDFRRTGDQSARDRLILNYSPLVKYVAGRLGAGLPTHVEESDLVSYGLIGLIGAIERFDPTREIKFETFAISRIRGAIIDELRALDWVPRSVRSRARDIERAIGQLEAQLHRAPTDEEIARKLDITYEELEDSLDEISRSSIIALDELWTVTGTGDQISLIDTIDPPSRVQNSGLITLATAPSWVLFRLIVACVPNPNPPPPSANSERPMSQSAAATPVA